MGLIQPIQFTDEYTTTVNLTPLQYEIMQASQYYQWLVAILGRRSGKTTTAIEFLIDGCWDNPRPNEWPLLYVTPYFRQGMRIAWNRFKQHFAPGEADFKKSDALIIHKPTGSHIYIVGCDRNPDAIRGWGVWRGVVDEIKDIPKYFLQEVYRPCFSDTGGKSLIIGTPPKVKGIAFEYYQRTLNDPRYPNWIGWNVGSEQAGIIPPEELEQAKNDLDPEAYAREYKAAFNFLQGLVVKHFSTENIQPVEYDPGHRLHISCDFNVDPCMWVIAQRFPPYYHFIDEVVKENTTVNEMVDEFARRYPPDQVQNGITINGDASGGNRNVNTNRVNETSYTIMTNRLRELGYTDIRVAVHESNPGIQDRIDAYNAKIMNANGHVFIKINPRCKWLIYNHENVAYIEGTSDVEKPTAREIKQDREKKFLIHILEAAQYIVEYYDPIKRAPVPDRKGVIVPKALKFRA